ncbi:MAG: 6-carboxytetrahydropterin synthase QueD [Acidobacteriota bacterium]
MPYIVCKEYDFAAGHRIPEHPGKCRNLHGHNYRVRVHLRAETLDPMGMVIDFAELKTLMHEVIEPLDHRVLNELPPFEHKNPTSENLAEHIFREVEVRLPRDRVRLDRVELWENDTSCAIFER